MKKEKKQKVKVFLSPFYDQEEWEDVETGSVFKQVHGAEVHSFDIDRTDLGGIEAALRKNILFPYDLTTRKFLQENRLAKKKEVIPATVIETEVDKSKEVEKESKETIEEAKPKTKTRTTRAKKQE